VADVSMHSIECPASSYGKIHPGRIGLSGVQASPDGPVSWQVCGRSGPWSNITRNPSIDPPSIPHLLSSMRRNKTAMN